MSNLAESDRLQREVISELARRGDGQQLRHQITDVHPADLAEILDRLESDAEKLLLFGVLSDDKAGEVIRDVSDLTRAILLENLADSRITAVIEGVDTDDAADIVGQLPQQRQKLLLYRASPETRREVEDLLSYPADSAGGIMKTEVASVTTGTSVLQIRTYLRRHRDDFHDIHNVFVTDHEGRLIGYVPVRELVLAEDKTSVDEITESEFVSVSAEVDQEEVAHLFEKYDLLSLPVIDEDRTLVGRITVDDIVDVIEEEATEDMLKLAGVGDEPLGLPGPLTAVRSRLPWLGVNLLTATVSAATISLFEHTIHTLAIAAAFMTIVASQGGNAGVQTMTLVVRGLALGEVRSRNARRMLGREFLIALSNGTVLGLVAGVTVYLWRENLGLALVMGFAMIINLIVAAVLGTLIPLSIRRLGADPALSSPVFVTAGTDVLGFFIFLGLLTALL